MRATPSRRSSALRVAVFAVTGALCACDMARTVSAPMQVRDSAGVRIVEIDWGAAVARVDTALLSQPILRVGAIQGDPDREFDRIAGIVPLSDGAFAVADAGSLDIRVFAADGTLTSRFGREGDGPGELRAITAAFAYRGDSIAVHDLRANRVSLFARSGGEPRSFVPATTDETLGRAILEGVLADGGFVVRQNHRFAGVGVKRASATVSVLDPAGEPVRSFDPVPGDETYAHESEGFAVAMARPYPVRGYFAADGDRVVIADGGTGTVTRWSTDGAELMSWRTSEARTAFTVANQNAHRDSLLEHNPMPPGMDEPWAAAVREMPYPDSVPLIADVLADGRGGVWQWRQRPAEEAATWAVIDAEGQLTSLVRVPGRISIRSVTPSRIHAVATDELGVQYVEVYDVPWS